MAGDYMPTREELTEFIEDESDLQLVDPNMAIGSTRAITSKPIYWRGLDAIVKEFGYPSGNKETNHSWRQLCIELTGRTCPTTKMNGGGRGFRKIYRDGHHNRRDVPDGPLSDEEHSRYSFQSQRNWPQGMQGVEVELAVKTWDWRTQMYVPTGVQKAIMVI